MAEVSQHTSNFGVAVLATLFGYDGWILIANLGGEMKNPQNYYLVQSLQELQLFWLFIP